MFFSSLFDRYGIVFFMLPSSKLLWISLVIYLFYRTFIYYQHGQQFHKLRSILGLGICISRATATILNLCCALVLLPLCKKLNKLVYRMLSRTWPGLFFFWLEKAKSFHITVAVTLILFSVIHSISHFVNLWSFSRNYDDDLGEINVANYRNENPIRLLLNQPGISGVMMLVICVAMGVTSSRAIRRVHYNAFWYTHQLYLLFYLMLLVHPLSGVLKEEIYEPEIYEKNGTASTVSISTAKLVAVKSTTWLWLAFPLCCFFIDFIWRIFSRNQARFQIIECTLMAGRMIRLVLSCPADFQCRIGQYVLLQCPDVSAIEWHPFSLVQIPAPGKSYFTVWIRVNGDWTSSLEQKLLEKCFNNLIMLVDGPFCSAMESIVSSNICICVAAGVGITPYVAILKAMLDYPCSRLPSRVHLIWIVKRESEISWIADLATQTILRLRYANKPDRLNLEIYITETNSKKDNAHGNVKNVIVINGKSNKYHVMAQERVTLLTPKMERNIEFKQNEVNKAQNNMLAERYPIIGCRIRSGRPNWDRFFGNCVQIYPGYNLDFYCCGPKKLVKSLRNKCKINSQSTRTKFTFIHEENNVSNGTMSSWTKDVLISPGENYFAFNLGLLIATGSLEKTDYSPLQRYAYSIYSITFSIVSLYMMMITFIGTYQLFGQKLLFFINLGRTTVGWALSLRLLPLLFSKDDLRDLITEIMMSGDNIRVKCMRNMKILLIASATTSVSLISAFTIQSFLDGHMTIYAWMPFDPFQSQINLFMATMIILITFVPTTVRTIAHQCFVCSLLMYFCEQLKELQWRLKCLEYHETYATEFQKEFKDILIKHVRMIWYSKKLNAIYKPYFLVHNLGVTLEVCVHAIVVSMVGFQDLKFFISLLTLLTLTLTNTYVQCYFGNEMILQSLALSLAAWEANWTIWPVKFQKDLLLLIASSQKELKLSAGGFSDISLRTYASICYNGYTVFTVLHDMI